MAKPRAGRTGAPVERGWPGRTTTARGSNSPGCLHHDDAAAGALCADGHH